jgi:hypothetical protein
VPSSISSAGDRSGIRPIESSHHDWELLAATESAEERKAVKVQF